MSTKPFVALLIVLLVEFVFAGFAIRHYLDRTEARIAALERAQGSCVITLLIPSAAPSPAAIVRSGR
jgi:hypothetical protein